MKEFLYAVVDFINEIHDIFRQLNDAYGANLSDKDLHFLVIGLLGMAMIFMIYPIFSFLAKKNCIMAITWIYVFTVIVVISFVIEIGQKVTKSGRMEFADIMYGLVGFLTMFLIFSCLRMVYRGIRYLIRCIRKNRQGRYEQ